LSNQTITVDTNHDALTGRNAGEDITINSGAVLTIDSDVQETAMGLMGRMLTNDGKWLIDGRNVKEVAYSSGSGTLPAIGDNVTDSGGASGKVIRLDSGTAASGVMTITEQSGTFTATNTISDSGTFSATIDSVVVGYLIYLAEDNLQNLSGLATVEYLGAWYELGTGDGTDSQVFTLPHSGCQAGLFVETASGSGVYEKWWRSDDVNDSFTDFATGDLGKIFQQPINTATVTFGTSTNGGVPPSGAKIRMGNVHLGTATLAAPTTERDMAVLGSTNFWEYGINSSNAFIFDKVNFSSVRMRLSGGDTLAMTGTIINMTNSEMGLAFSTSVSYDNCIIISTKDIAPQAPMIISDSTDLTLNDCVIGSFSDNPIQIQTSTNGTISNCKLMGTDATNSNNNRLTRLTGCSDFTISDTVAIRAHIFATSGCSDITITNWSLSNSFDSTKFTNNSQSAFYITGCSDITIDGASIISGGTPAYLEMVEFNDSSNCTLRNVGSATSKLDMQSHGDRLVTFVGLTTNCKVQRVYLDNQRTNDNFSSNAVCDGNFAQNCSGRYNSKTSLPSKNMTFRGVHASSGALNSTSGFEVDFQASSGLHIPDVMTSDTTGRIHCVFTPPSTATTAFVTLTNGAVFNRAGDLLLRTTGDIAVIESTYTINGHDSFQNTAYAVSGVSTGNIDVEYALDTGSGYGAYKDVTGANLSAESIAPTGFDIKFRFTANATASTTLINGFFIDTNTTLTSQTDNYYPFNTPTIQYDLVETGTCLKVYNDADDVLLSVGNESGGSVSTDVPWNADFDALARIRVVGYETIDNDITVVEADQTANAIMEEMTLIPLTDPGLTANITITNHGASPVSWDAGDGAKDYSITIQTTATGDSYTGIQVVNEINYNINQDATYQSFNGFAWPDMVVQSGTSFESKRGRLFGSLGAELKGVRVINSSGTAHSGFTRFQADDGTYGTAPVVNNVSITGMIAGSRLQIYNVTTATEIVNAVQAGTSYSVTYTEGVGYTTGDTVRVRLVQSSGVTAYDEFEVNTIAGASGWSILAAQVSDAVYNAIGIDGSSITKFSADYVEDEVDLVVATNFSGAEFYAWWSYNTTTSQGLSDFFGGVTAVDQANFLINNSIVDVMFDSTSASNFYQSDNRRIYRADGAYPVKDPTTGGGGIDIVWKNQILIADTGVSGLTATESTQLMALGTPAEVWNHVI